MKKILATILILPFAIGFGLIMLLIAICLWFGRILDWATDEVFS